MSRLRSKTDSGPFGAASFLSGIVLCFSISFVASLTQGQGAAGGDTIGVPWTGEPGVTETVSDIMAREKDLPLQSQLKPGQGDEGRLLPNRKNLARDPASPHLSQWPPAKKAGSPAPVAESPLINAQSVGVSFLGAQLSESGLIPPDSQAAAGPSQVLVCVNGRIKVLDKTGLVGALNTAPSSFFSSQTGNATTDPHLRYDRLSGRWFVIMVDTPHTKKNNKVLIAVSSGASIADGTSFTFFSFTHSAVSGGGDSGFFADYPTLGIDNNALYIGANMFSGSSFAGTSGYVINKSNLLAGTLTVTAFRQLATSSGPGPASPQGVDNDDPGATQGFFVGVDNITQGRLVIRRISDPGGVPSISGDLNLTVPDTAAPAGGVPALGTSTSLDALDDRLFVARLHNGSLWTAHNIEVDASGTADPFGGRVGSRWYEINNLTNTPVLRQSGTLFDPAANNPVNYWIPSCTVNGQGQMVLGCSVAGVNEHAEIAVASRLANDLLGTLQSPSVVQTSSFAYNVADGVTPHRWGDFSLTTVDPNDNMTFWTAQEYCNANNSWGVRIIQIKAPPPAIPWSCNPGSIAAGAANVEVVVTGRSTNGSGFFDPGAGFPNHLVAALSGGGVAVNDVTFTDPTHATLNLTVSAGAVNGARTVTVTNPDGQAASSASGILSVTGGTNHPPTISALPDLTIDEDTSSGAIAFSVGDLETAGANLTVSVSSSNTNLVPAANIVLGGNGANRTLTVIPATNQNGATTITVTVTDAGGAMAGGSFLLTVNPVNDPPALAPIAAQIIHQGTTLLLTNIATDVDLPPDLLTYSLGNAPAGAAIDSSGGVFTWTPAPEQVNSTNDITVIVTDNGKPPLSDAKAFTVTVISPPKTTLTRLSAGTVSLAWTAIPGTRYRLQYKADLNEAAWTDLTDDVTATAATVSEVDPGSAVGQRFYRILVLP